MTMLLAAVGAAAMAAPGDFITRLDNPHPGRGDLFGSPAQSNVVEFFTAAPGSNLGAPNAGIAYEVLGEGLVFAEFANPLPEGNAGFGHAIALRGYSYAFSAPGAAHERGTVYLFERDTLTATIVNPRSTHGDGFGEAAAFSGDILAIGAPKTDEAANEDGVVYICDGSTGGVMLTIENPTPESHDRFGSALAGVNGGLLLVGVPQDNTGGTHAGSAYLYDVNPVSATFGQLLLTINNPTPGANEQFGFSVSGIGDDLAIGAYRDAAEGHHAYGSAYIFDGALRGVTSTPQLSIHNPNPAAAVQFGYSLAAIRDEYLVIGANRGRRSGVAYVYDASLTGTAEAPALTLVNPDHQNKDGFGTSVAAIYDGTILVGAPQRDVVVHDGRVRDAGSVFLFEGIAPVATPTPTPAPTLTPTLTPSPSPTPLPIITTSVLFEVDSSLSDFTVTVEGAPGVMMNFQPMVFGSIGADVMMQGGEIVGVHIKEFDMGANDISSDVPFIFNLVGLRTVMGNGRGMAGPETGVNPDGSFDQKGNAVEFDGNANGYIREADLEFNQDGGPTAGSLPLDFPGSIVETPGGMELRVPAMIQRKIKWGDGPFEPMITATGMLIAIEEPVL